MELFERTASELSSMLRNKECSSVEITESVYNRIEKVEDKVVVDAKFEEVKKDEN